MAVGGGAVSVGVGDKVGKGIGLLEGLVESSVAAGCEVRVEVVVR